MPGNEFGDRIHYFFGLEGLSQDQHQSQALGVILREASLQIRVMPITPQYSRSVLQEQQNPTNGYMHVLAMPTEANILGVNAESSRDKVSARGFTSDPHKSPMRFEMGGSPVNYDFFGGQQQLNSQLPGMLK
uniref:Uncharacterized protein n=1 Tax=Brassica oleracea TaxID=3712 RepID=A0A3P6DS11_BRAOL|nr:unnamed protein product [Brassica oleracea]